MITQIILLVILTILNAFFASSEIAFISLNDYKIKTKANEGNKKAKEIMRLLNKPSQFLATIQIGITLAGFLSSAFASEAFAKRLAPFLYDIFPSITIDTWNAVSIIVITIILSFFMLIFGELIPKRIAMKHDEKIAYKVINIIVVIEVLFKPFVYLLTNITNGISKLFGVAEKDEEHITEEEIRMIISQGKEKGAINKHEHDLINNVLEFNDILIKDIMVSKDKVFMLKSDLSIKETVVTLKNKGYKYSRIPLYDNTKSNIVGILHVKDLIKNLLNEKECITSLMQEPLIISSEDIINKAFIKMNKSKKHMALVYEEDTIIGIVTMEDILEEIVGEINDEQGI